jgi:hypothetical protein
MINNTKSGIGSGVLKKASNPKKFQEDNRASIEDFENAEKQIADNMK